MNSAPEFGLAAFALFALTLYARRLYRGRPRRGKPHRGLVLTQLSQLLTAAASFALVHPLLLQFHRDARLAFAGVAVAALGTLLVRQGRGALGDSFTFIDAPQRPGRVVREGVYRWLAHPIYAGNMLFSLGLFLAAGTLWGLGGLVCAVFRCAWAMRVEDRLLDAPGFAGPAIDRAGHRVQPG